MGRDSVVQCKHYVYLLLCPLTAIQQMRCLRLPAVGQPKLACVDDSTPLCCAASHTVEAGRSTSERIRDRTQRAVSATGCLGFARVNMTASEPTRQPMRHSVCGLNARPAVRSGVLEAAHFRSVDGALSRCPARARPVCHSCRQPASRCGRAERCPPPRTPAAAAREALNDSGAAASQRHSNSAPAVCARVLCVCWSATFWLTFRMTNFTESHSVQPGRVNSVTRGAMRANQRRRAEDERCGRAEDTAVEDEQGESRHKRQARHSTRADSPRESPEPPGRSTRTVAWIVSWMVCLIASNVCSAAVDCSLSLPPPVWYAIQLLPTTAFHAVLPPQHHQSATARLSAVHLLIDDVVPTQQFVVACTLVPVV